MGNAPPDRKGPVPSPAAPRVAFFPDSFHEVNGVAHTSRNFVRYAQQHSLPMLCVRAGTHRGEQSTGSVTSLELPRSSAAVRLEKDLTFDPLFPRHLSAIDQALRRFRPDLIHITGPSELGIAGAWFAWRLGIPLAASWHTNLHEYAARRIHWLTRLLPRAAANPLSRVVEAAALWATTRFYSFARLLFAPNPELCAMLEQRCHHPCHLMQRGVDTGLFTPARRSRPRDADELVIGYVGRLSIEKNVSVLPAVAAALRARGVPRVRFRIIGHGKEESALRSALPAAEFPGVLRGEALAASCADMDLLLFPSHTDTFGNVVLEALASGVPALVTAHGGPRHIVADGVTGFVVPPDEPEATAFADRIALLAADPGRRSTMREAARAYALGCTWNAVFDRVYSGYAGALAPLPSQDRRTSAPRRHLTG